MAYGIPEQRCPQTKGGRRSYKSWLKKSAHRVRRISWRRGEPDPLGRYRGYET